MSATAESIEKVQKAAVELADGLQGRLFQILGRQPDVAEFMAFYTGVAGTTAGHALAMILGIAGKETAGSWISEFLGTIQLMARRSGADVILQGGVELKEVPSVMPKAVPAPEQKKDDEVCRCAPSSGDCQTCKEKLELQIGGYSGVVQKIASLARGDGKKVCRPCARKMIDRLVAAELKKSVSAFGDELPAALEVFMAIMFPQIKAVGHGVAWTETEKAITEVADAVKVRKARA